MRLYSPEWVAAFNGAVAGLGPEPGVSFRMVQVVHDGPEGTVTIVLEVTDGAVRLERQLSSTGPIEPAGRLGAAGDVTVSIAFDDAAALARGAIDPAQLLADGRVKVRGDLSVLVKGQQILAAASARLGPLSTPTTR